jgi:hypothetical protein
VFFDQPGVTLGENPFEVAAQAGYPENVLFRSGGLEFGTVHIVGSNDDLAPWYGDRSVNGQPLPETPQETALRLSEVEARQAANLAWLERIFARASRKHAAAVVIGIQADMWDPTASDLSGFDVYKQRLAELATEFEKQVLLLNGDSHEFYADQPLSGAPNLSRITVNGSTSCPHEYLRLRIDVTTESVFSYARVPLPSSEQLCPA